jgi:hypothetical protein
MSSSPTRRYIAARPRDQLGSSSPWSSSPTLRLGPQLLGPDLDHRAGAVSSRPGPQCPAVWVDRVRADSPGVSDVDTAPSARSGHGRLHGRSVAAWHRRGPVPMVPWAGPTASSRPHCRCCPPAFAKRAAASYPVSARRPQCPSGQGRGVHSDRCPRSTRTGVRGLLAGPVRRPRPVRWPAVQAAHRPRHPASPRVGTVRPAAVARGLQERLVGAVAAAWVPPPAAAGTGDLAGKPGPQRGAGQRHRRAGQRPRLLARLEGQLQRRAWGRALECGLPGFSRPRCR